MKKSKYCLFLLTFFIIFSIFGINVPETVTKEHVQKKFQEINELCNIVSFGDGKSEEDILEALKTETAPFERGKLCSALVTLNTIKGNYDNILKYSKEAIENYRQIPGGEYYAIEENKYLAWSMLSLQRYPESFEAVNESLEFLKIIPPELVDDEFIEDTDVLINVILLNIYSNLDIKDAAKRYYDKLNNMNISDGVMLKKSNSIAYSKMNYAYSIKDYELMKKYATECYNLTVELDKSNEINSADGLLASIADSNIRLGNLEEGLEQIQKSEAFYKSKEDRNTQAYIQSLYAMYYDGTDNIEKAYEFYKDAINGYFTLGALQDTKIVLDDFFAFCEKRGITDGLDYFYKLYYSVISELQEKGTLSNFLDINIKLNEDLNNFKVESIKSKKVAAEKTIKNFIVTIIILCSLLLWSYILFKQKKDNEKKLEKIANEDYLTGINTRAHGFDLLNEVMNKKTPLSLAILDIDNFKDINDTYGHLVGDEVIKGVANLIKETVHNDDITIRFGGEEFIIAFINKDITSSNKILEEVKEKLKEITIENVTDISFSAGIVNWNNESIHDLLSLGDNLLYKAKSNGRDRIEI